MSSHAAALAGTSEMAASSGVMRAIVTVPRNDARERSRRVHLIRTLLRVLVGGLFIGHGTQKLFGWFGGYGPDGTGQFFDSVGIRPGRRNALAAGSTEAGCGVLIALGLATPLAAAGLSAVMITALRTAVWNEGIKPATGEHEVL